MKASDEEAAGDATSLLSLDLEAGSLLLRFRVSPLASLFHLVDQISGWSPHCRKAHIEALSPLSPEDQEAVARHAGLRRRHPWSSGRLERLFYREAGLGLLREADALRRRLPLHQAVAEREVLLRFEARSRERLRAALPTLEAFAHGLGERAEWGLRSGQLARLFGVRDYGITVFLLPAPSESSFGGGFHGHCITLEVPRYQDVAPILLHELLHALMWCRRSAVEAALRSVPDLSYRTLDEGVAHAFAPGLFHGRTAGTDPLPLLIEAKLAEQERWTSWDREWLLFHRFGLALRPLLASVLLDPGAGLEDTLLPGAIETWRMMADRAPADGCGNSR